MYEPGRLKLSKRLVRHCAGDAAPGSTCGRGRRRERFPFPVGHTEVNEETALSRPETDEFDELYRRERHALVRLGVLLVGSQAVAEELVHDAFIRMHTQSEVTNCDGFL